MDKKNSADNKRVRDQVDSDEVENVEEINTATNCDYCEELHEDCECEG